MTDILIELTMYACGAIVAAKFAWLGYIAYFHPERLPDDDDGPVSGWGTG